MRTKCVSVRLESLRRISDKAYLARSYDGSEDVIPASQVYGPDYDVTKSEAWWIAEWILAKKNIQWSGKKSAWFDSETKAKLPDYTVTEHKADRQAPVANNEIQSLKK